MGADGGDPCGARLVLACGKRLAAEIGFASQWGRVGNWTYLSVFIWTDQKSITAETVRSL